MNKNKIFPIIISFSLFTSPLLQSQTISVDPDRATNFAPSPTVSTDNAQAVHISPGVISIEPSNPNQVFEEEKIIVSKRASELNIVLARNNIVALMDMCSPSCNINEPLYLGNTALHMAAKYGNLDMYKYAIEKSAIYKTNNAGETPLHLAAYSGNIELMDYILKNTKDSKKVLNEKNKDGQTALFYAFKNYHNKEAPGVFLIGKGLDCNIQDKAQQTAMHLAMVNKKEEYYLKFMQMGCNLNILDKDLGSPLDLALRYSIDFNVNQQLRALQISRPTIANPLDIVKK